MKYAIFGKVFSLFIQIKLDRFLQEIVKSRNKKVVNNLPQLSRAMNLLRNSNSIKLEITIHLF